MLCILFTCTKETHKTVQGFRALGSFYFDGDQKTVVPANVLLYDALGGTEETELGNGRLSKIYLFGTEK